MRIAYLYQYYTTNEQPGGTRAFEFTRFLAENNFRVDVISGKNIKLKEPKENLNIYTTNTDYTNNMPALRRIYAFFHYVIKATFKGLLIKQVDLIFATSTPLTIGIPAVVLSKLKGKKLIFEVRDVWPDVPIELGYIKNKFMIKILKLFETWIYKNSSHIIVLSSGMYENLRKKGVSAEKMTIIENISNLYLFDQIKDTNKPENLINKFICIHPGTMGPVNGLDFILDTAKIIKNLDTEIVFLLIGKGKKKESLQNRVTKEEITNVIFQDIMPKKDVVKLIKSSNIGIMCVDNSYKILEDNSANKFFDFLAAGLPVLINYRGWQKEAIETNECGYSCLTPQEMADKILCIKKEPSKQVAMAINSRKLAENRYSDIKAKEKLLKVIEKVRELNL
jgi:glycosyltransferase involved in cell wall biosynthesis